MKLIQSLRNNSKLDCAFFGAIAGAIIFILLYGFLPLDVTNDRWIINGYVEADIRQHYAGWLAFRNAEWSWPLGYTDKKERRMSYETAKRRASPSFLASRSVRDRDARARGA